jgi:hypothetical protein
MGMRTVLPKHSDGGCFIFSSIGRSAVAKAMAGHVPIDENNLSSQNHDGSAFQPLILNSYDGKNICARMRSITIFQRFMKNPPFINGRMVINSGTVRLHGVEPFAALSRLSQEKADIPVISCPSTRVCMLSVPSNALMASRSQRWRIT